MVLAEKSLLSKLVAAGLTAGVFLIWWPYYLPTEGLGWLVLRGSLWTLLFEGLVLSWGPLERLAWGRLMRSAPSGEGSRWRRLGWTPIRMRTAGSVALAVAAVALPATLLWNTPASDHKRSPLRTKVVRQVIVKRETQRVNVPVPAATAGMPLRPEAERSTPVRRDVKRSTPGSSTPAKRRLAARPAPERRDTAPRRSKPETEADTPPAPAEPAPQPTREDPAIPPV